MPKLNPDNYNPDSDYLFSLLERAGIGSSMAARFLKIDARILRHMLRGKQKLPYSVQFALEWLAENPPSQDELIWPDKQVD